MLGILKDRHGRAVAVAAQSLIGTLPNSSSRSSVMRATVRGVLAARCTNWRTSARHMSHLEHLVAGNRIDTLEHVFEYGSWT
jgi:hypothetical protein